MNDRALLAHPPEVTIEGHFDGGRRAIMVAATPGVVVDIPGGFEGYGAVSVLGGESGGLVEAGAQDTRRRPDFEASAVDKEDGVAVAQ